jgi:hypothetical protein
VAGGGIVTGGNADTYGRLFVNGVFAGRSRSGWNRNGTLVGDVWMLLRRYPHGTTFQVSFTTVSGTGSIESTPIVTLP